MKEVECVSRSKGPEKPLEEEIFKHPSVIHGRNDYFALSSGQSIRPQVTVGGKTYELAWDRFDSPSKYINSFSSVLQRSEEKREEGIETSLRLEGTPWSYEYLPLLKMAINDIRRQLFGFGWQALEGGSIIPAYSAFRASGFLHKELIVQKMRSLFREDSRAMRALKNRWLHEFGIIKSAKRRTRYITKRPEKKRDEWEKKRLKKAEKTIERARQSIEVLAKVLL